jgi:hypothetical protein
MTRANSLHRREAGNAATAAPLEELHARGLFTGHRSGVSHAFHWPVEEKPRSATIMRVNAWDVHRRAARARILRRSLYFLASSASPSIPDARAPQTHGHNHREGQRRDHQERQPVRPQRSERNLSSYHHDAGAVHRTVAGKKRR